MRRNSSSIKVGAEAHKQFLPALVRLQEVERHKFFIFPSHGSRSLKKAPVYRAAALNVKVFAAIVVLSLMQLLHLVFSLPRERTGLDAITRSDHTFNK
jgi:hypothetical protein